jgi:CheY-like chemotaxis protein
MLQAMQPAPFEGSAMVGVSSVSSSDDEVRLDDGQVILVVDDDAGVCGTVAELLEDEGFRVATAVNGRAALDAIGAGLRPAAIVLDLMMPVMDGWDFRAEQLRDPELRDVPVVVMTAAGFSADSIKLQFGDIEFVAKPFGPEALLEAIKHSSKRASLH